MTSADDALLKNRIRELDEQCYSRDIIRATDFLDLREQSVFHGMERELSSPSYALFGGHEDADRAMAFFLPSYMEAEYIGQYASQLMSLISAEPLNGRFTEELSHRDYLGALMNLGIERSKIGDILTEGGRACIFASSDMAGYICDQLFRVRHTSVSCSLIPLDGCDIKPRFSELRINVASERADEVIAAVFKLPRELASELIASGGAFMDGRELSKPSAQLRDGSRVSVRGHGKFIYLGMENMTRKGRLYVDIKKYV